MILRTPKFLFVYLSQLFSLLADNLYLVALPWLVLQITGSTLALGSVFALSALPRALLLPIGGVWADRTGPRRMMVVVSLLRGLILLSLVLFVRQDEVWVLYLAALALGTASAFYYPAEGSVIPRIVSPEQLPAANGLVHGTTQLLGVLGPALGGVLVGALGGGRVGGLVTLLVASGGYVCAATLLVFVRLQREQNAERPSFATQLREGIETVLHDPALRRLIGMIAFINLGFVGPFYVGLPALVRQTFGLGAEAFGSLAAAFSLGSLIGVFIAAAIGSRSKGREGKFIAASLMLLCLGIGLLGTAPSLIYALGFLLAAGLGSGIINVLLITLIQLMTAKELLGRVMSLILVGSFGLSPVSQFLAGAFAEHFSLSLLFPIGASVMLLVLLLNVRWLVQLGRVKSIEIGT